MRHTLRSNTLNPLTPNGAQAYPRKRATTALVVSGLAFLMALSGILGRSVAAQEATPTLVTEAGVLEAEPSTLACAAVGNAPAPTATATAAPATAATTLTIVSEESEARYRAQEELASVGATEAVGRTSAMIGQILFDAAGMPLACSRFDVDLRTLTSDEVRRDNYLYTNTLETAQYPLATFVLTEVQGLDQPVTGGEERSFFLIGNLTLHGVTKLVAWEATASREGDTLTGSATTSFEMPDFNIEPPVVGPVVSLDETVTLEVEITAEPTA